MGFAKICSSAKQLFGKITQFTRRQFEPVVRTGNPDRALKKGEFSADEEKLRDLNKTWREMLRDDPWRKKLMTHVGLLTTAMGIFFLMFWIVGLYLPPKHFIFNYICAGIASTIPYWLWVGKWNNVIEKKVFEEFKKKLGKHFHLK